MASVKLRKRINTDGTTSLYLDIYTYYTDLDGNKKSKRKYEFLDECKLYKISSPLIRVENKNKLNLAEQIRNNKEKELLTNKHEVTLQNNDIFFIDFCKSYLNEYTLKNKKNVKSAIDHFVNFSIKNKISSDIHCSELKKTHIEKYLKYLEGEFNGETIETYFRIFKRLVKTAYKRGFIKTNIVEDVICKKGVPEVKDILDFSEIQLLAKTPCPNIEVRKAFLFSCYTGLRWVDINALTWSNIKDNQISMIQAKTKHPIEAELNSIALQLLGERKEGKEKVFKLPSHAGATKTLKKWCMRAEILKHITWHSARHSFGTNIVYFGANVNTASSLLGHKNWDYTQRYVHKSKELEIKAIKSLPEIIF